MEKEQFTTEIQQHKEKLDQLEGELRYLWAENERMLNLYYELTRALIDDKGKANSLPALQKYYNDILEMKDSVRRKDAVWQEIINTHWTSLTDGTAFEVAERLQKQCRSKGSYPGSGIDVPITEDGYKLQEITEGFSRLDSIEEFVVNAIIEKRKAFYQSGKKDLGDIMHKEKIENIQRQIIEELESMTSKMTESN